MLHKHIESGKHKNPESLLGRVHMGDLKGCLLAEKAAHGSCPEHHSSVGIAP